MQFRELMISVEVAEGSSLCSLNYTPSRNLRGGTLCKSIAHFVLNSGCLSDVIELL